MMFKPNFKWKQECKRNEPEFLELFEEMKAKDTDTIIRWAERNGELKEFAESVLDFRDELYIIPTVSEAKFIIETFISKINIDFIDYPIHAYGKALTSNTYHGCMVLIRYDILMNKFTYHWVDLIRHELSHIYANVFLNAHGHDKKYKFMCSNILNGNKEICSSTHEPQYGQGPLYGIDSKINYVLYCENCDNVYFLHKKIRNINNKYCGACDHKLLVMNLSHFCKIHPEFEVCKK